MENEKTGVREAVKEDLEEIIRLLFQLSPPAPGGEFEMKKGHAILKNITENPDYVLCVAIFEGRPVGTALLLIQQNLSHGGKPYGHVENVVTDINFRGNGIGLAMVRFLVSKAREKGCYKVILDCEAKNIPFYEKCGFRLTGESEMRISV